VVQAGADGGQCRVRLLGDYQQGRADWGAYGIVWRHDVLDLALLRQGPATVAYAAGPAPCARLARVQRSDRTLACVAVGFPRAQRHDNSYDSTQVNGEIPLLSLIKSGAWQVSVRNLALRDPLAWKGVSGSALFAGERLIGVITVSETFSVNSVLVAQPFDELLGDAGFLRELGRDAARAFETFDATHDPRPWAALKGLTYLVDRNVPVGELSDIVHELIGREGSPRALVCAVPGEPQHEHGDLIELFRKETLPTLFPNRPGFDAIEPLDWPLTAETVPQGLRALRGQIHRLLGIQAGGAAGRGVQQIADTLNLGDKPRAYWCEIRASRFTALHRDLLQAWVAEWDAVAAAGLNDLVAVFICLVFDEAAPADKRPWWKPWAQAEAVPSLQVYSQKEFATIDRAPAGRGLLAVRLSDLAPCERQRHLNEWRAKLERQEQHRWLQDHVLSVRDELAQDLFPMRTLLDTLERLSAAQATGR
jgi:hypothetical protein